MKRYLYLLFFLFIAALNFNLILKPMLLVTGGTQGITIILNNILHIKPYIIILFINITMLIISYLKLDRNITYGALISTISYPIFIKLTNFKIYLNVNILIQSIITGIISGITGSYIYKLGFSTGGISMLNLLINKYLKIRVSVSNLVINTIIIIIGGFMFGFHKIIYSILVVIICSLLINKIFDNRIK